MGANGSANDNFDVPCGKFDAESSASTEVTGQSATVETTADKHEKCITEIPMGRRRRNKAKDCQLKAKCEFV